MEQADQGTSMVGRAGGMRRGGSPVRVPDVIPATRCMCSIHLPEEYVGGFHGLGAQGVYAMPKVCVSVQCLSRGLFGSSHKS